MPGLTLLIVRNDLLARKPRTLPNILTYAAHAKEKSLLNTSAEIPKLLFPA